MEAGRKDEGDGCQWGRARCTERMAEEAHIKACVFAAVLLRDSGKPLEVGEILKIVKAAGTDGVSEATATTVITVLQAEQACLQLRAATEAQQQQQQQEEEESAAAAEMESFMDDDY